MVMHLQGRPAIALSLAALRAFAWVMQQRTGHSGAAGTVSTFAAAGSAPAAARTRPDRAKPDLVKPDLAKGVVA